MGDDEGRSALRRGVERRLQLTLGRGVERAGRFVEDQDRRILEERAGDREPLALAARQRAAALADERREALRLAAATKSLRLRALERALDLGPVASGLPTRRFSSIERAKRNGSWNTTPILARSEASVMSRMSVPSIRMRPRCGIEDAMQKAERRRFARAGRADQRDRLVPPATSKERSLTAGRLPS